MGRKYEPQRTRRTRRKRKSSSLCSRCSPWFNFFADSYDFRPVVGAGGEVGDLLFERLDALDDVGELREEDIDAPAVLDGHGGGSDEDFAVVDVIEDAGLRGAGDVIADLEMSADAGLAGEGDVVAEGDAAGDSGLYDELVDLGAGADDGAAERAALDGAIGADFDIVFDDDVAGLGDFVMDAVVG